MSEPRVWFPSQFPPEVRGYYDGQLSADGGWRWDSVAGPAGGPPGVWERMGKSMAPNPPVIGPAARIDGTVETQQLALALDGDGAWPDLAGRKIIKADSSTPLHVAVVGGRELAIRIDLPDGQSVLVATTARLFCGAAKVIMAKYPDLFHDGD